MKAFASGWVTAAVLSGGGPAPVERVKRVAEETLNLHRDAIHIYIGIGILIGAAMYFRGRWSGPRLLVPVLVSAFLLELIDLGFAYAADGLLYGFSFKDIVNTCAIPVIIWLALLRDGRKASTPQERREDDGR